MFVIILVMLFIVCALAFAYKRSKVVRVHRNIRSNLTTTVEPPPAYKPEDHSSTISHPQPAIFTIANSHSLPGRHMDVASDHKDFIELPPTYEEAIVISQNVCVVPRRS